MAPSYTEGGRLIALLARTDGSSAGPKDYSLLRNGQKKLVRSLEEKAFFQDKYYKYLVGHLRPAAQRAERGRGLQAERLATDQQARGRHGVSVAGA